MPSESYLSELRDLLKFGGLWFEKGPGVLGELVLVVQLARIPVIVLIEVVVVYGALRTGPAFFTTPSSAFLTLGLVVVIMFLPFATNYPLLKELLASLERSHEEMEEAWKHEIIAEEYTKSWRLTTFYKFYTLGFTLLFPAIGILIDLLHYFQGREIFRFPQCLDMYDTDERSPTHYTIVVFSWLWINLIGSQNVAVIGQMFVFVGLIKAEIRVLIGSIGRLPKGGPLWPMRDIVKNHQKIIRLHDMFTGLLGFSFAAQSIVGGINTCLLTICLLIQYEHGSMILVVLILSYAINFQALLLLCSLEGETLQQQHDDLRLALYDAPWYEQGTDVRKTVLMMLRQMQKPLALDYKRSVPLNLKTYSQIVSRAYSYLNLFLKSESAGF